MYTEITKAQQLLTLRRLLDQAQDIANALHVEGHNVHWLHSLREEIDVARDRADDVIDVALESEPVRHWLDVQYATTPRLPA